jgi:hypothetical protein
LPSPGCCRATIFRVISSPFHLAISHYWFSPCWYYFIAAIAISHYFHYAIIAVDAAASWYFVLAFTFQPASAYAIAAMIFSVDY